MGNFQFDASFDTKMSVQENEEQEYEFLRKEQPKQNSHKKSFNILYLPFGLITSLLSVVLFLTVGGADLEKDKIYFGISYALGAIALTMAYTNVNKWCHAQKAMNGNPLFFSLFYNNAFYVFSLILCSSIIFSGLKPAYNLLLSQTISVALPAWLSSLQI